MVTIEEVEGGLSCGCTCPGCGDSLVAKRGQVRAHHFAHLGGSGNESCRETALHAFVKQVLVEAESLVIPRAATHGEVELAVVDAKEEAGTSGGRTVDVLLTLRDENGRDHRIGVEVCVTHASDEDRVRAYRKHGLPLLEIEAHDLAEWPPEAIRRAVLRSGEHKWWPWHPLHNKLASEREAILEQESEALRQKVLELKREIQFARAEVRDKIADAEWRGHRQGERYAAEKRRRERRNHRGRAEATQAAYEERLEHARERIAELEARCSTIPSLSDTLGAMIYRSGERPRLRLDVAALQGIAGLDADYVWATVETSDGIEQPLLIDRGHTESALRARV